MDDLEFTILTDDELEAVAGGARLDDIELSPDAIAAPWSGIDDHPAFLTPPARRHP